MHSKLWGLQSRRIRAFQHAPHGMQPYRTTCGLTCCWDCCHFQVATGRYHTLALTSSGEVYSWGLNDRGQLGRPAPLLPSVVDEKSASDSAQSRRLTGVQPSGKGAEASGTAAGDGEGGCTHGGSCHDGAPALVQGFAGVKVGCMFCSGAVVNRAACSVQCVCDDVHRCWLACCSRAWFTIVFVDRLPRFESARWLCCLHDVT